MQVRTIYPFTKRHIDFLLPAPFLSPTLQTFQHRDVVSVLQSVQCTTPAASVNSGISSALAVLNNLSMYVYTLRNLNRKTQFFLSSSNPSLLDAINNVKASLATASTAGKHITTACTKSKAAVTVAETKAAEASTYLRFCSLTILLTISFIEKSAAAAATAAKRKEAARASAQRTAASQAAAGQQVAQKAAQTATQKEAEAKSVADAKAAAEKALWEAAETVAEAAGKALVNKLQGSSGGKSGSEGGSKCGSQVGSKAMFVFSPVALSPIRNDAVLS